MATVRDLITDSLSILGAIGIGETPSADEAAQGLRFLNGMVESWNLERLMVYAVTRHSFPLVPSQASYTIGVGGNFNVARPTRIELAAIELVQNNNIELPLQMLTIDEWNQLALKSTTSTFPQYLFYINNYPLGVLYFWPVPTQINNVILWLWNQISAFTNLSDTITLPQGYWRALVHNLAVELAPQYGKPVAAETAALATQAKELVKRNLAGAINLDLQCDNALMTPYKTYNWLTDNNP